MAQYQYAGRDRNGKARKGKVASGSKREAIIALREKGIAVSEISETAENLFTKDISFGNPVKTQDFVIYLRQFSTLLTAGVSVMEATQVLANQTESKALRKALFQVEEELRTGKPLSEAAAMHERIFPPMFVNLLKAGEATGNLDETLDRLATYFEKQHRSMQKVKSALAYPLVISVVAVGVVIFLLASVVPTFAQMFAQFDAELPAITKFVMALSDWMQSYWWLLLLLIVLGVVGILAMMKNPATRKYVDYSLLKIPLFGKLIQKSLIAKMTRTLSSLFGSSVPVLEALSIVERVVQNEIMAEVLRNARAALQRGQALSDPLKEHWIFPPLVTQMIVVGEKSGSLDMMLRKIADFYEQEVEAVADSLKSLIEPIMIIVLAGVVGGIVISIIVPMFEIFNHIK